MALNTIQGMIQQNPNFKYEALQVCAGHIIYGGRVLDQWDKRCLNTLFKGFFSDKLTSTDFSYLNTKVIFRYYLSVIREKVLK